MSSQSRVWTIVYLVVFLVAVVLEPSGIPLVIPVFLICAHWLYRHVISEAQTSAGAVFLLMMVAAALMSVGLVNRAGNASELDGIATRLKECTTGDGLDLSDHGCASAYEKLISTDWSW